jgi:hypothetical protein
MFRACGASMIQRRPSLKKGRPKARPKRKGCAEVLQASYFFWILCVKKSLIYSQKGTRS